MPAHAPVAQLDRAPGFEPGGRRFESVRARHLLQIQLPRHAEAVVHPGEEPAESVVVDTHGHLAVPGQLLTSRASHYLLCHSLFFPLSVYSNLTTTLPRAR